MPKAGSFRFGCQASCFMIKVLWYSFMFVINHFPQWKSDWVWVSGACPSLPSLSTDSKGGNSHVTGGQPKYCRVPRGQLKHFVLALKHPTEIADFCSLVTDETRNKSVLCHVHMGLAMMTKHTGGQGLFSWPCQTPLVLVAAARDVKIKSEALFILVFSSTSCV